MNPELDAARVIEVHVFAEYCPGPFFWGWHTYMAPVINGVAGGGTWDGHRALRLDFGRRFHWFNSDWTLQIPIRWLQSLEVEIPEASMKSTHKFSDWLGEELHLGFRVGVDDERKYHWKDWNWTPLRTCDSETLIEMGNGIQPRPWRKSDFYKEMGVSGMTTKPEIEAEFKAFALASGARFPEIFES